MDNFRAALREFLRLLYRGIVPPDVPTAPVRRAMRAYPRPSPVRGTVE